MTEKLEEKNAESDSPFDRLVMDAAAFEELQCEISDCINKKISSHNLSIRQGANLLCEMASDAISCLDWKTQEMQAANAYINDARKILHT